MINDRLEVHILIFSLTPKIQDSYISDLTICPFFNQLNIYS